MREVIFKSLKYGCVWKREETAQEIIQGLTSGMVQRLARHEFFLRSKSLNMQL